MGGFAKAAADFVTVCCTADDASGIARSFADGEEVCGSEGVESFSVSQDAYRTGCASLRRDDVTLRDKAGDAFIEVTQSLFQGGIYCGW